MTTNILFGLIGTIVLVFAAFGLAGFKIRINIQYIMLGIILIGSMSCESQSGKLTCNPGTIEAVEYVEYPGIYALRDTVDLLDQFGWPEIRTEHNDTVIYEYVDYLLIKSVGGDIVFLADIMEGRHGINYLKVQFDSGVLFEQHQKRFHAFMKEYAVDYSDSGCEFGWDMSAIPYRANYTLEQAMRMMSHINQEAYNRWFCPFNE